MATDRTSATKTAELADALFTVMPMVVDHVNDRLEELGMTNTDYWALRSVDGPMPMKDLANCMSIDPSYVTLVADRLEELGLIERQPHTTRPERLCLLRTRGYLMAKNPFRPFTPDAEFMDLLGDYSGNEVNGLNEPDVRPPSMVWWAPNMDSAVFGEAQKWFYGHEEPDDEMTALRARRRDAVESPLPLVAGQTIERSPEEWTAQLQTFVDAGDCEMTGVAPLRPEWIFDHEQTDLPNVIVLGVQHDYEELQHVPELRGGKDVTRQYVRAAEASKKVAAWLRDQGHRADAVTGPMTGKILLIPPALECGFGELGKHGSIINPEFGSAFRLGAVLTDAPFAATPAREFGIDDFCSRCRVCENACPPEAIKPEKQTVRGVKKWFVDFDQCIPFFAESSGCAICIAVCPWSRPGVGLNIADKLARRARILAERESASSADVDGEDAG